MAYIMNPPKSQSSSSSLLGTITSFGASDYVVHIALITPVGGTVANSSSFDLSSGGLFTVSKTYASGATVTMTSTVDCAIYADDSETATATITAGGSTTFSLGGGDHIYRIKAN